MRESIIEAYLHERVREIGGDYRRVSWSGRKHAPDDLILLPGKHLFVECKRPGKNHLDPLQVVEVEFLRSMGFRATWVNTLEDVDRLLMDFLGAARL